MADTIVIKNLEILCRIGITDEERARPQKLKATITMVPRTIERAALLDDLTFTVDYFEAAQRVKDLALAKPRKLIEKLAEDVAAMILETFTVKSVEVEIRKFVLPDAEYVSATITRKLKKKKKKESASPVAIEVPSRTASDDKKLAG